jgi:Flp pilus assembly protein protease CpaA
MRRRLPDPPPVATDDVRTVTVGTALWAVALVAAVVFRERLRDGGHLWWVGACLAGFVLGLVGLAYTRRRAAAIARDEAAARASANGPGGAGH